MFERRPGKEPYGKQSGRHTSDPVVEVIRQAAETGDPEQREKAEGEARRRMTGMHSTVDRSGTGWDPTIKNKNSGL